MTDVPSLSLSGGLKIPQLGMGVWQIPDAQTGAVIASAIEKGYRLLDGAFIYGNEAGLGEGIRLASVPRQELFITTKVWNADQGRSKARASVARSLETMRLDYLDLVLIHWPCPVKDLYVETWEALIEMQAEGLMRSIGVSNFNPDHLDRIIDATGVAPVLNQIEVNPKLANSALRAANDYRGILTQAWTPLGEGKTFGFPHIADICARTGKSPAQVTLRWHMQLGHATVTRALTPQHQGENLNIFDFELTAAEMATIATLDWNARCGPDPLFFEWD
jgi:2,5-diketo-D-gluconate reductase A